ncbi:MAG: hypothetical protein A3H70_03645 [Candidatus Komeilibacteria bacterium RIFCSPLOWO2_02_FULL_48_11]|uniref:Four helix bundle protein n=1 Tax=Candidatus Komeilibacteria bacterium RIFCSPLOWO2_02_FULL_48_11 TaxID=1798553 RepID=A0A1G2BPA4_9BACT|nr:MAG: hypothetical protein A3H70_03645 [Candidatus Komeilibacteria bacterium RIFCSPLOWO2_02_FULL_48_11]
MPEAVNKKITGYRDLDVYQNLFRLMTVIITKVIIKLPKEEKFDLVSQMRRASKACPALLAEGFAKRYQKKHWSKYLDDCLGECNEMIHHLEAIIALYSQYYQSKQSLEMLIDQYDKCSRQLTKLKQSWVNYHKNDS